ncbi:MAG TPA: TonB-dependent receptor [Chitinophagaceae bacterium]|nr:TonB-dependent receptor [Chitinophagaceae bacterium]
MKIISILLFAFCLQLSAKTYSQKVTLHGTNISLEKILKDIKIQTGYVFFYNYSLLKEAKPVSIDIKNVSVNDALTECLKGQPIDFVIENKTVVLTHKPVVAYLAVQKITAIPIKVQGNILDQETGRPLEGATISVRGTDHSTISNNQGYFEIEAESNQTINVSYVGFLSYDFKAKEGKLANIYLKSKPSPLNEVLVVGYGNVKRADLTGSVSSVKGDVIARTGTASFDQALQGRVAGVNVTSNGGLPGGGTTIRIRGIGSINSGNDPLYVVDGMPIGNGPNTGNLINPEDIEQIEILKDASAAAIYGSEGSNGVILITTKRGKLGAPKLVFDTYQGTKKIKTTWQPGDAAQFGEAYLIGKKAAGASLTDIYPYYKSYYSLLDNIDFNKDYSSTQSKIYNTLRADHPESTNWMPALFKTATVQNYNLFLSGGSEAVKYATSVSYYKEDGIIKTTGFDRLTFRFNGDYKINSRFKTGTNLTIVTSNRKGINPLIGNNQTGGLNFHSENSVLSQAYEIDPVTPIRRTAAEAIANGGNPENPYDLYSASLFSGVSNPVAGLERNNINYNQLQLLGNAFGEYSIFKNLTLRSSIGINFSTGQESSSFPDYYISGSDRNLLNSVRRVNDRGNNWDWINQLNYSLLVNKHSISVMAAIDASHTSYQSVFASKTTTPSNVPDLQYLHNATGNASADDDIQEGALVSYLGRLNYAYNNKYLITGTFRRDGSSSFSTGYRWGNFSSVGLGYKISEEKFFKNLKSSISLLKIRGSWGQLGNSAVPPYSNLSLYNATSHVTYPFGPANSYLGGGISNYPYQTLTQGVVPFKIGNGALRWERSEQKNLGIDIGLFDSKVNITADYFIKTTKDNLLQVPVPPNVGYAYALPYSNSGKLENKGFELTADYKDKIGAVDFSVGGNISFVKNKVISLGYKDASYQHYGRRFSGIPYRTIEGHPLADFYGFQTLGIFQTQEEVNNYKGPNGTILQPNVRPGDFKYANINNNETISDSDKVVLGSPLPKYTLGFYTSVSFKGFDLDLFFQGQHGNKILMYEKYYIYNGQGNFNSIKGLPDLAWHGPNTSNTQPRISANDPNDNFRMSDYYLEDGSYIRLKTMQIGYRLPSKIISQLKLSSCKIYCSADNLLTFTKYPGIDPELASTDIQNMGFSSFEYPQPHTVRVGIKVGF